MRDLHTWPQYHVALAAAVRALGAARPSGQTTSPGATGAMLPPPYLPLPLSTGFLVLLASACAHATEPSYRASSSGGYSSHFTHAPALLSYASTYLPHGKPSRVQQAPHLRLLTAFLRALLPQPSDQQAKPALRDLGGVFLAVLLEMLLTDGDMPAPAAASAAAALSPGLSQSPNEMRGGGRALASSNFMPPMPLRTKCIRARSPLDVLQALAATQPAACQCA